MGSIWAISASNTNPQIVQVDTTTGATLTQFTAPRVPANKNGRGLTVDSVNQLIYYGYITDLGVGSAATQRIYLTNFSGSDLGVWLDMSTLVPSPPPFFPFFQVNDLCIDGSSIWVTNAVPVFPGNDNHGYQVDIASKTLLQSVVGMGNLRDGLYVNSTKGIAILNTGQGSGPYSLYSLSGGVLTLTTSGFINPAAVPGFSGLETGITFDGAHYITSNPKSAGGGTTQKLYFFDPTTGAFVSTLTLPSPGPQGGGIGWLLENLSAFTPPPPPVAQNFRIQLRGVKRWPKVAK